MIGYSLLTLPDAYAGRAIIQYADTHANLAGDKFAIPVADKPGKQFVFEKSLVEVDSELIEIARAHALWPRYAYRQKKYLTALVTR